MWLDGFIVESTGTGATAANITITGTGGAGSHNEDIGTFLDNGTQIAVVDGDIDISGQGGGDGTSSRNFGTAIINLLSSPQARALSVTSRSAVPPGTETPAIMLFQFDAATVSTVDGDIGITGTGAAVATGDWQYGGYIHGGTVIESTGTGADAGNITLTGTGGEGTNENNGWYISNAGTRLSTVDGNIAITALPETQVAATEVSNYSIARLSNPPARARARATSPSPARAGMGRATITVSISRMRARRSPPSMEALRSPEQAGTAPAPVMPGFF